MNKPAFLALTTLLLCIAPGTACLGADSASPLAENARHAGSKSGARSGEARRDNPFERMAQATAQELRTNALFDGMDFEIFVAKPFVVLMTRESGADRGATDERKGRIDALTRGVWRHWLKARADWQLRSTRNDTLENPEPFVWVFLHSKDAYDQYMKKAKPDGKHTPGSQAGRSLTNC